MAFACDDSFSPLVESDLQLSLFGYLDVSADTQWLRVTRTRPAVPSGPSSAPALVLLENLENGSVVQFRDSLFHFDIGEEVGSEGLYLHNYWSTQPLEPATAYRLTATPVDGGAAVHADVQLPPDYSVEIWLAQAGASGGDFLRLEPLTHLGLLSLSTWYSDGCGSHSTRRPIPRDSASSSLGMARISKALYPGRRLCGSAQVEWRELFVVGSGAPWPEGDDLAVQSLKVPEIPSNVRGGVGFIGGVLTRTIPYENCIIEPLPDGVTHCVLRYGDQVVSFRGRVVDTRCGGDGVAWASVELRELLPDPAGPKLRFTTTSRKGEFRIEALDPRQRYALSVRRFDYYDPFDQFREHQDTLTFSPGEQRHYDVSLERYLCPA